MNWKSLVAEGRIKSSEFPKVHLCWTVLHSAACCFFRPFLHTDAYCFYIQCASVWYCDAVTLLQWICSAFLFHLCPDCWAFLRCVLWCMALLKCKYFTRCTALDVSHWMYLRFSLWRCCCCTGWLDVFGGCISYISMDVFHQMYWDVFGLFSTLAAGAALLDWPPWAINAQGPPASTIQTLFNVLTFNI